MGNCFCVPDPPRRTMRSRQIDLAPKSVSMVSPIADNAPRALAPVAIPDPVAKQSMSKNPRLGTPQSNDIIFRNVSEDYLDSLKPATTVKGNKNKRPKSTVNGSHIKTRPKRRRGKKKKANNPQANVGTQRTKTTTIPKTLPQRKYFLFPFEMEKGDMKLQRGIFPKKKSLVPLKRLEFNEGSIQTYDQLFGPYFDKNVRAIKIHEPHLNKEFQLYNLVRFLEACVINAPNLRLVRIMTTIKENPEEVKTNLKDISDCLLVRNIIFAVEIAPYYHDRSIVFDNGYAFDLGIGLHYFQRFSYNSRFALGLNEQRLRPVQHFTCNISRFGITKPDKTESEA